MAEQMSAVIRDDYGSPEVLRVERIDVPAPKEGEVVVEVAATTVQPFEWHAVTGEPRIMRLQGGLRRPKVHGLGLDVAGTVVAVGSAADGFEVGDRVWGFGRSTLAEFARCNVDGLQQLPDHVSFEHGAAMGVAALTALQAVRDKGEVSATSRVLVNGAAGGVGTFAVQIASHLGATVTGVCSGPNTELVRSLGAAEVVDYTVTDLASMDREWDVIVDCQGNLTPGAVLGLLSDRGTWVIVGGPKSGSWFGPIGHMARGLLRFAVSRRNARPFIAQQNPEDLAALGELLAAGTVEPVIGSRYPLARVVEALELVGTGHARGKVIVTP